MDMVNVITLHENKRATLMSFEKKFLESFTVESSIPWSTTDIYGTPVHVYVKPEGGEVKKSTLLDVLNFIVWTRNLQDPSARDETLMRACIDEWQLFCANEECRRRNYYTHSPLMPQTAISFRMDEPANIWTFVVPSCY